MQMGLMNVIIGAAMVLLVLQWPRLTTFADYGLFLSTMVVLTHWHYGTTFVLFHLGPTISLNKCAGVPFTPEEILNKIEEVIAKH